MNGASLFGASVSEGANLLRSSAEQRIERERERERAIKPVRQPLRNRSLSLAEISIFEEHFLQPDFDRSDRLDKSLAVHVQCKI